MKSIIEATTNGCLKLENHLNKKASFLYMFLSSFLFAVMSLFVKFAKTIPPYQVIYSRAFLNVFLCFAVITNTNYALISKDALTNRLLIKRGVLGGLALSLYFHSIYFLPLSIVAVLQRISPLWIGIFGALFYNEVYKLIHVITTIIGFLGVLMILKPSFLFGNMAEDLKQTNEYLIGMIMALANSLVQGFVQLMIRELKDKTNVMIVVFYFNFFNLIFAGIGQFFESARFLNLNEWVLMAIIGVLGWVAQLMRARSLFLEKAFILSILGYSQIIFSYCFDIFLLDETIDTFSYIGIIVIILSMGALVYSGEKE